MDYLKRHLLDNESSIPANSPGNTVAHSLLKPTKDGEASLHFSPYYMRQLEKATGKAGCSSPQW